MNPLLPVGYFSIPQSSGMSINQVYSFISICENLYRQVVIFTDFVIDRNIERPDEILINPKNIDGIPLDFFFLTGEDGSEAQAFQKIEPLVDKDRVWTCWMPKRGELIPFEDAEQKAKKLIGEQCFSCVCVPNVTVKIGPVRDMFFDVSGVTTSLMVPTTSTGFWREVFRASGYYDAKAHMEVNRG